MHENEMRHWNVPKWLNTDKPQRQKQCFGSSQPHFTNSCAVPSRGDWGNSKRHRTVRRLCRCHLHFCRCAFSVLDSERGNICPKHMHTHGSSPGEEKATYDCWFHSPRRTNPLLILFEGGKCDATKTGASTSSADPSKESGKGKLWSDSECVNVVELSGISHLKVPAVEDPCFVLFHFNQQPLNCPQQRCDVFNTAGIQPPDMCCHQFSAHWAHIVHVQYTLVTKVKLHSFCVCVLS